MEEPHDYNGAIADQRDKMLRRLVSLLNLTQDMKFNERDEDFAKVDSTGNPKPEIIYCFDQGIFEAFLRPSENSNVFELFHAEVWSNQWHKDKTPWSAVSSQSTMIGANWLISGNLPGQRNNKIFMSEWHFREFYVRYRAHRKELETYIRDKEKREEYRAGFLDDASLLHDDPSIPATEKIQMLLASGSANPKLKTDINNILKAERFDADFVWQFALTRYAAMLLSTDDVFVRTRKLGTLHSTQVVRRLAPIHSRFQPRHDDDRRMLKDSAGEWFELLDEEQARRNRERRSDGDRPIRSLKNDAKTLAYLSWISRNRLKPHQKIVLVTGGDDLLINAYRRWYIDQPIGEPFLLRRATQYAPLLNLDATPNNINTARLLFDRTRNAVEVTLYPFNMSSQMSEAESEDLKRLTSPYRDNNKHFLSWRLAYTQRPSEQAALAHFRSAFTEDWIARQLKKFGELRSDWQMFERSTIGANYHLVRDSLEKLREDSAKLSEIPGDDSGRDSFVEYLTHLLDDITSKSIRIWFPLASDFVSAAPERHQFQNRHSSRVPIALQLRIPSTRSSREADSQRGSRYDLVHVMEEWIEAGEKKHKDIETIVRWASQSSRPDIVFAIAATLALRLGHLSDADFFAELACTAVDNPGVTVENGSEGKENYYEYVYLRAVSKRLRMGSINPTSGKYYHNLWRMELETIIASLRDSEKYYSGRPDEERSEYRLIRAVSERAAARIFYITWAVIYQLRNPTRSAITFTDWEEQCDAVQAELRSCYERLTKLRSANLHGKEIREIWTRLFKQVIANLAATHVLLFIAFDAGLTKRDDLRIKTNLLDKIEHELVETDEFILKDMPPATHVDVLAFLHLVTRKNRYLKQLRKVIEKREHPRISIDKALFNIILASLNSTNSDGPG